MNQPGPLLSGKTAVVTGAGSGIGRAIAATFSLHGAFVVCADQFVDRARETVDLVQGIGGQAVPMACDVQLIEELGNAVEKATGQTVRLDIMVKNAGVGTGPRNSFLDHDREDFERLASVNFLGVVQGCQWQSADSSSKAGAA